MKAIESAIALKERGDGTGWSIWRPDKENTQESQQEKRSSDTRSTPKSKEENQKGERKKMSRQATYKDILELRRAIEELADRILEIQTYLGRQRQEDTSEQEG